MSESLDNLFGNAAADGILGVHAQALVQVADLGAQIQDALGISVEDVSASDVTLVTQLIDDSGSIRFAGNADAVRLGHNTVVDALAATKQASGILAMTRYLNGTVLFPYALVAQAVRMNTRNYDPNLGTPLFDAAVETLAAVVAKAQQFRDAGVACRTVTLIVTDGADGSRKRSARDVAALVADMQKTEEHIVAAMGIDDGSTDFTQIFTGWTKAEVDQAKQNGTLANMPAKGGMGILPRWVLTPGNSPAEIRAAFMMASQSAVRASQGAQNFGAAGGFGTP